MKIVQKVKNYDKILFSKQNWINFCNVLKKNTSIFIKKSQLFSTNQANIFNFLRTKCKVIDSHPDWEWSKYKTKHRKKHSDIFLLILLIVEVIVIKKLVGWRWCNSFETENNQKSSFCFWSMKRKCKAVILFVSKLFNFNLKRRWISNTLRNEILTWAM